MANVEDFGIKEQEFSKIFKSEPIYTPAQFGKYFYGDLSEILTLKQLRKQKWLKETPDRSAEICAPFMIPLFEIISESTFVFKIFLDEFYNFRIFDNYTLNKFWVASFGLLFSFIFINAI